MTRTSPRDGVDGRIAPVLARLGLVVDKAGRVTDPLATAGSGPPLASKNPAKLSSEPTSQGWSHALLAPISSSDLRARQRSICDHQPFSAPDLGRPTSLRQTTSMSFSTSAASPTTGTSTRTFLLMEEASTSMWILREPGEKASTRPVMRSSKRAPMHTIRSQSCIAMFAS